MDVQPDISEAIRAAGNHTGAGAKAHCTDLLSKVAECELKLRSGEIASFSGDIGACACARHVLRRHLRRGRNRGDDRDRIPAGLRSRGAPRFRSFRFFPCARPDDDHVLEGRAARSDCNGLAARRAPLRPLRSPEIRPLLFGAIAIAVATALAATQADYRTPAIREILKALEYAVLFAAILVAFAADADGRPIDAALIAVTIVVALAALSQAFMGSAPSGIYLTERVVLPRIAGPLPGPINLPVTLTSPFRSCSRSRSRGGAATGCCPLRLRSPRAPTSYVPRAGLAAQLAAMLIVIAIARPRWGALRVAAAVAAAGFAVLGSSERPERFLA